MYKNGSLPGNNYPIDENLSFVENKDWCKIIPNPYPRPQTFVLIFYGKCEKQ